MKKRYEDIKFIGLVFLLWRVTTLVLIYIASLILPYRQDFAFTHFSFDPEVSPIVNNSVIGPLANFDGIHYLSIALNGYTTDGRYFPLYPLLIRTIPSFLGIRSAEVYFISSILVTTISFFLSLLFLYKMIRLDYSQKTAKLAIVFLLLFPTSFFFGAIYSESLFLMFSILAFYLARLTKWPWVIFFASSLAVTRIGGILIIPALIYEYFRQNRQLNRLKLLMFILPFVPLFLYSLFNYLKWRDWLYFIHNQGELANGRSTTGIVFFGQTIFRYFKILIDTNRSYEWWLALLELGSFIFGLLLIYQIFKKRLRKTYIIYSLLFLLLSVSSGTFSGLPRYLIVIFPLFVALALIKNNLCKVIYIALSIFISSLLIMLFARGYYVA